MLLARRQDCFQWKATGLAPVVLVHMRAQVGQQFQQRARMALC
jgi:hypothetical protein